MLYTSLINEGHGERGLNLRTLWEGTFSADISEEGLSSGLSLASIANILIKKVATERAKGRAKALFDVWTNTLNMKNYGKLVGARIWY